MKAVIGRGIFLSFLFTAIAAVYIYFLLDLPLEESWFAFYELQFADVPLGWWILNTTLLLGLGNCHLDEFFRTFKRESH